MVLIKASVVQEGKERPLTLDSLEFSFNSSRTSYYIYSNNWSEALSGSKTLKFAHIQKNLLALSILSLTKVSQIVVDQ